MMVTIYFVNTEDGSKKKIEVPEGVSILEAARMHDVEIEGACEGSLACATCHVIVDDMWFNKLPSACDDEEDMLDMAIGLTDTSRLGCQIILTKELDGLVVTIPPSSTF